jgi:ubiquinone biosynthesis accessory factor UbiJ
MLDRLPSIARTVAVPRAVLLANHIIAAEPAAVTRLKPMAGRRIDLRLTDLPPPLSWAPAGLFDLSLAITPAGLLEWVESPAGAPDLLVSADASNPLAAGLQVAGGARPPVRIEGDAALASEVSWLLEHLRWDLEDDVGRLVGPAVAHQLAKVGSAVKPALARFAASAAELATRLGPRPPSGDAAPGPTAAPAPPGPSPR